MSANAVPAIDAYPALKDMGITRFHEISNYNLHQEGKNKDVLRVYYKRAKGSLLPYSRKYVFGRSMKTVIADSGTARLETNHEISPFLLKAVSELETIVHSNQHIQTRSSKIDGAKSELLAELDELARLIRESQCDNKAIVEKLVRFRENVKSL